MSKLLERYKVNASSPQEPKLPFSNTKKCRDWRGGLPVRKPLLQRFDSQHVHVGSYGLKLQSQVILTSAGIRYEHGMFTYVQAKRPFT